MGYLTNGGSVSASVPRDAPMNPCWFLFFFGGREHHQADHGNIYGVHYIE